MDTMNTTSLMLPSPPPPPSPDDVCFRVTFNISSFGFWENDESPATIFRYSLPLLEMQIIVIFLFTYISHLFLGRIGIPQFASQIVAGLILGPQMMDLLKFPAEKLSFDPAMEGATTLECIAAFGCMMFVFLMAVKTNTKVAFRNGKLPVAVALLSVFVPLFVGVVFRNLFTNNLNPNYMHPQVALMERSVVVSFQSLTVLPVVTNLLSELKILNSELGRLATSAAVISDLVGIFLLAIVSFLGTYKAVSQKIAYRDLAALSVYVLAIIFLFRPILEWVVHKTPEGKPVRKFYIYAIVIAALGSSAYTSFFNTQFIFGPLIFGLAIPDGPPIGSALEERFEKIVKSFFLPVFVTISAMKGDVMRVVYEFDDICYNMFLVALTLVVKLAASLIPCLYCKLPLGDSFALAAIMNCKGFIELFLYEFAKDRGGVTVATKTFVLIYILLNAGIVPTVVNSLYDPKRKYVGYIKRNIMNLKPNSELRVIACLHKPDNVSSMIGFLQLLSPPKNPNTLPSVFLAVTVLHLMKLVGRVFPVMISHRKRPEQLIQNPYIETSLLAFNQFERDNWGSATVAAFTAFSPENLMHEDVCNLALDQLASMVVVPSGRKWSINGKFESEDEMIRLLNSRLLDRVPCSLGILVDRGQPFHQDNLMNKKSSSSRKGYAVGVIFIGGKDDREALSVGNRMRQHPGVNLTVIRFISKRETEITNWEYILDYEVLRDWKQRCRDEEYDNVSYEEKSFDGGAEVTAAVRSLASEYNLLIVGRNTGEHSPDFSGLTEEWMDLPELGPIGDLLASKDIVSTVSGLVVQQQQQQQP